MDNPKTSIEQLLASADYLDWVYRPTEELEAKWQHWLSLSSERRAIEQEAREYLNSLAVEYIHLPDEAKVRGRKTISTHIERRSRESFLKKSLSFGVILFFLVGAFFYYKSDNKEVKTNFGETKTVHLDDGSVITLNSNSKLNFSKESMKPRDREVWLEGEAYFDVMTNFDQPFLVHTSEGLIKVLGTSFNVKDRTSLFRIVLQEGRIEFLETASGNTHIAVPGDALTQDHKSQLIVKSKTLPRKHSAWLNKKLIFDNTTLREIGNIILDEYGYELVFKQQDLSEKEISGTIENVGLDELMYALSNTLNIQLEIKSNQSIEVSKTK